LLDSFLFPSDLGRVTSTSVIAAAVLNAGALKQHLETTPSRVVYTSELSQKRSSTIAVSLCPLSALTLSGRQSGGDEILIATHAPVRDRATKIANANSGKAPSIVCSLVVMQGLNLRPLPCEGDTCNE
jgi:hypothetical protein